MRIVCWKRINRKVDIGCNTGGYLFFESQTYENDIKFEQFIDEFKKVGFTIIDENMIKENDNITERSSLLKKTMI